MNLNGRVSHLQVAPPANCRSCPRPFDLLVVAMMSSRRGKAAPVNMSNPLLRPNDPRFQKPDLRDAAGKNQFAEGSELRSDSESTLNAFAPSGDAESRPYLPEYGAQQHSRSSILLL